MNTKKQNPSRIVRTIHEVWDKNWPDRVGSVNYSLFSLRRQHLEIQEDLNHIAKEMADQIIIEFKWLMDNGFDPEKTVIDRLKSRHRGHTKAIAAKYGRLWRETIKGSDASIPNIIVCPKCGSKVAVDLNKVESIIDEQLSSCYAGLREIESEEGMSPEKKTIFRQKWRRIINDTLEVRNKLKIGKKGDIDPAMELMKRAEALHNQQSQEPSK